MPEHSRKIRTISLRLSEAEYEALHNLYPNYGARNISDFARLAMQRALADSLAPESMLAAKVRELDNRMRSVEAVVSLLRERGAAAS